MFKKILEKLATMTGDDPAFGGDVAYTLRISVMPEQPAESYEHRMLVFKSALRACYDLGLIEALPPPQDGEVLVHADRARVLLDLVESWRKP